MPNIDSSYTPVSELQRKVLLCQTIVPDYRLPLFLELKQRFNGEFGIICGDQGFVPALRTCSAAEKHVQIVQNVYLGGNTLLWQRGLFEHAAGARLVIIEFNLRAVSTWRLLMRRARDGKPTVMWGHASGRRGSMAFLKRWMFRRAAGFIAYTQQQRRQLLVEFPNLPIWCAPNAVLWARDYGFLPRSPEDIRDIVHVGRLVSEKKPGLLLDAFLSVAPQLPAISRLVFVGEGPERKALESRASAARMAERVVFLGHVSDTDRLRSIYSTAICSVSPGYVGLSATQSFGFGVPMLIARDEPHSPEIEACRENFNTIFFPSDDAAALGRTLLDTFRSCGHWRDRRAAIVQDVRENYSMDRMAETFGEVIAHFAGGNSQ